MDLSPFPHSLSIFFPFPHSLSISSSFSHSRSIFSQPGCQAATSCATLPIMKTLKVWKFYWCKNSLLLIFFLLQPWRFNGWNSWKYLPFYVFYFVFEGWRFIRFIKARIYGWRWVVRDVMPKPLNPIAAQLQSLSQPFLGFFSSFSLAFVEEYIANKRSNLTTFGGTKTFTMWLFPEMQRLFETFTPTPIIFPAAGKY